MRTAHQRVSDEQLAFVIAHTQEQIALLERKLELQRSLVADAQTELDARAADSGERQ